MMKLWEINDEEMFVWAEEQTDAVLIAGEFDQPVFKIKALDDTEILCITYEEIEENPVTMKTEVIAIEWTLDVLDSITHAKCIRTTTVGKLRKLLNIQ